ncbi:Myosin heavy chain, muscle-like 14 [Homarus americanus]|uniref:Myosin heavy chain, muscle-like 14 n=1 Tax=Homarus americanus TaxID=6706 RepID=A0A8J5T9B4_HOMAM|nr:Myosin heavy chain, muscle-like 14 [Homarus americanus]
MHQLTCNGVLEGIRICRKGFPNRMVYPDFKHRYKILASKEMSEISDDKKAAKACFDKAGLEQEHYRLGNTKVLFNPGCFSCSSHCINLFLFTFILQLILVYELFYCSKVRSYRCYSMNIVSFHTIISCHSKVFFRAGVLGTLEEIRDDRLGMIITWMQSWVRGYISRSGYKRLQEQRISLNIVQRSLRHFLQMRTWAWYSFWQKVKPLLNVTRIEDEMRALKEKAAKALEDYEKEVKLRQELEAANVKLLEERNSLLLSHETTKGSLSEFLDKQAKLQRQKADLEAVLTETAERLQKGEEACTRFSQDKKKTEQEFNNLKKNIEDLELSIQKLEQDKVSKDHQVNNLNGEIRQQEELINKLNKEKKHLQECNQKTAEDAQCVEDKCNHLNKVKAKLEQTLDELEDALEREKKQRIDLEKAKRKVEGDQKLTLEAVADLERNKKELEQTIERKDKEFSSLYSKLEDEQGLLSKVQRQVKESESRIEELEEDIEHERQTRAKTEKAKSLLARELDDLGDRLDEAGGATAAQIELNKKREAEITKLRKDLEESNIQHESSLALLCNKHHNIVAEMSEQIDNLNKTKVWNEREKVASEKMCKQLQHEVTEVQSKLDETNRNLNDYDVAKKKLAVENSDLLHQLEEAESLVGQLSKLKLSLTNQLEDTKKVVDEESRASEALICTTSERGTILGKFRNLEHDIGGLREQLDDEGEAKANVQRQLSKANAEALMWRSKYESEGVARTEELEAARSKLSARLEEAESQIEQLNIKNLHLEKTKQRSCTELEEMQIATDRAQTLANAAEKKQKNFNKIISEWKLKVDDLSAELDTSQKECRNYSTEHFRMKTAYEENLEHLDSVRRENKKLSDEVNDLMDQIGEGGRSMHEVQKTIKRLEIEKEELQAALDEAEAALEQEENKVLRGQLELSQVRQEIDRRINEKEEESENIRKCHQRAIDSMQATLETEAKGKADALRIRKKLESDIDELEIALDHSNKANYELQKHIKKIQIEMKDQQAILEDEQRLSSEYREQCAISERRANTLQGDLEESRTLLEQSDRGRRYAESELSDCQEQLNMITAQNNSLTVVKRKLESEMQTLHADLDEMLSEAKNSEERAKKAMIDAARLADELRAEQEHAQTQEKMRKGLEVTVKELQYRLEESESNALKTGKKVVGKLEGRVRELEGQLDDESRRHSDAQKNLRKCERRIKELTFQSDEYKKNHEKMQDLIDKLQQKIKTYKRQIEEAEEIAALNLAKYRKAHQELEEVEEQGAAGPLQKTSTLGL